MAGRPRFLTYIVLGIILGGLIGGFSPATGLKVAFLGDIFLSALKMIVVPLVMASLIVGVTNLGDIRKLGGIGRRTIIYYMCTTGLSVVLGLVLVNLVRPGEGLDHGETHETAAYSILNGRELHLTDGTFSETRYDGRYQIILTDQRIAGTIDPSADYSTTSVTVESWWKLEDLQPAVPADAGQGVAIDLVVSDRVKGKDRPITQVMIDMVVGMVPTNVVQAMANTDVLPLIVFSLLLGGVLSTLGPAGEPVIAFVKSFNAAIMKLVHLVVAFTPVGVFGLIAARMGAAGGWEGFMPELVKLGWYSGTVIGGLLIHGAVTLPLVLLLFARRNAITYAAGMMSAVTTAFSTASSSGTLPVTIEGVENNDVSERTASFVLPLGATINMDGTALYEAVAALFIAQVYGIQLGPVEQIVIFLTATLAAVGAAGIPEAGLVTMVIVLRAVDLPIEGITLIIVIDWFLDRFRTAVNVWGDAVGAAVIERYERDAADSTPQAA